MRKVAEELWGNGVMEWWSDGKRSNGNTPTLQHSGAPLARGQVIWDDTVKPAQRASDAGNPLEQAKWVWFNEGNPAASAPVGKRYFRQAFVLANVSGVESARVFMTADNSFELWVNGRKAGSGDNFHVASALDVKPMLKRGTNLVAVAAENGGEAPNPAGLVGTVVVRFQDGHTLVVPTDGSWQASQEVGSGWPRDAAVGGQWGAALELGPMGMGPWGAVKRESAEPELYCDYAIVADLLGKHGVPPDFESDGPLRYTHRRTPEAEIYFIANREERQVEANCTFRVAGKAPELWDPLSGQSRSLPESRRARRAHDCADAV